MRRWIFPPAGELPPDFIAQIGGHPLVAETLYRRGYTTAAAARSFLSPEDFPPSSPDELPGLADATRLLAAVLAQGSKILVWGDFDVDGQTSTAILVSALQALGGDAVYHVPVRAVESHGVNRPVLAEIIAREGLARGDVLLTCDTGVSSHEALEYAVDQGLTAIVTDHHELPPALPAVQAIVNPRFLPDEHPLSSLSGAGVAYKVIEGLCQRLGRNDLLEECLDLVALGLVADLAPLRGEARCLVQRGLIQMQRTSRLGLKAIYEQAELQPELISEEHISFEVAPRLNAIGRLGDANLAVELLTTGDAGRARMIAVQLEGINQQRQLLTNQVLGGALAQLERDPGLLIEPILVLSHPAWPAGVLGIVASRLVERFHKPVILLSTPGDQAGRGSARSIPGVNITAAIAAQAALLDGFGGHPMAAGLSIQTERLPEFKKAIARTVRMMEPPEEAALEIDGELPLAELSLDLVADFERLAPFGAGNSPLTLVDRGLRITQTSAVGRQGEHLLIGLEDRSGNPYRAVWWQGAGFPLPEGWFDLVYQARSSNYRGRRELQVEWVDFVASEEITGQVEQRKALEVVDCRQVENPLAALEALGLDPAAQIWAEGDLPQDLVRAGATRGRDELQAGEILVIWTAPPGLQELQSVLRIVNPSRLVLFSQPPGSQDVAEFTRRLAGLGKYAINQQGGRLPAVRAAARLTGRVSAVRCGLNYLVARGVIHCHWEDEVTACLSPGGELDAAEANRLVTELGAILEESAAFRAYYRRAAVNALVIY